MKFIQYDRLSFCGVNESVRIVTNRAQQCLIIKAEIAQVKLLSYLPGKRGLAGLSRPAQIDDAECLHELCNDRLEVATIRLCLHMATDE
ncbi:MAG: hypothetical protein OXF72_03955 [Gammaproteobacteria bacterium]|nr:hypothetical protein [Gammaproteobacteria bacterium]MCY4199904.1 hypothetical protein [Gammaproteobacteria bacterium]MCY4323927.1 hypothetical protein [Gammaproteobacteria bacterium]